MDNQIQKAVLYLEELKEEFDTSKKLKEKTDKIITILVESTDMAVEKALIELEELNSLNLPPYHRTQVWDVLSLLESLKH